VGGRLTSAVSSDGTQRSYEYGSRDELLVITDPGRIVVNTYDDSDRVIKQITYHVNPVTKRRSERGALIQFAYKTTSESVAETDTTEYDGTHTVTRFDHQRPVMEILDAAGPNPIHVTYNVEPTEHTKSVTVSCVVRGVSRQRTVAAEDAGVEGTRNLIVRDMCER